MFVAVLYYMLRPTKPLLWYYNSTSFGDVKLEIFTKNAR